MKKTLSALLVAFCLATVVAFAQETQQEELAYEPSALTYRNVVVYKVFDHKDVVIVMYAKHDSGIAQVQIPKRWSQEYPRKLNYRTCPPGINPFVAKEVAQLRTYAEAVDAEMIMTMDAGKNAWDAVETADVFAGIGAGCLLPTRMDLIHRIGGVLSIAGLVGMRLGASGVSSSIADGIGSLTASTLSQLVLNTPSLKGR